jgi:hypothetical protein
MCYSASCRRPSKFRVELPDVISPSITRYQRCRHERSQRGADCVGELTSHDQSRISPCFRHVHVFLSVEVLRPRLPIVRYINRACELSKCIVYFDSIE